MLAAKLEHVNQRIEDLEFTETNMLEKLQRSINEHNNLMKQGGEFQKEKAYNSTSGWRQQ